MKLGKEATYWMKYSITSLFIVSLLGVILRYKIAFALPFIDQKHLLHAHSHFAFNGWICQTLMVLMIAALNEATQKNYWGKFNLILKGNLWSAYGMLISFSIQGYGAASIFFATIAFLLSIIFTRKIWIWIKEDQLKNPSIYFFKAAMLFNLVSAAGTIFLAYLMIEKISHQNWYLAAVYFYLHFQYNGWFLFACLGLLFHWFNNISIKIKKGNIIFFTFLCTAIPSYFLSALWMKIPTWIYFLVIISAVGQILAWLILLRNLIDQKEILKSNSTALTRFLLLMVSLAFTLKLLLQGISTIPSLSQYAFGFRPVVIGYLHLVLLGVITLFLLSYNFQFGYIQINASMKKGIILFFFGLLCNEILLMCQGLSYMNYLLLPYSNEMLLGAATIMMSGIGIMVFSNRKTHAIS